MTASGKLNLNKTVAQAKKAIKKGDMPLASQLLNEILSHYPNHQFARKTLKKLRKRPSGTGGEQVQIKALAGLYQSGRLAEAVREGQGLLKAFPGSLAVRSILGASLKGLGRLEEALDLFDQMISLKPDFADAYNNRGIVLRDLDRLEDAVKDYDKAVSLNPGYAEAFNNRGVALNDLGNVAAAIENYDRAIELKPDYANAYSNRGTAFSEEDEVERASADFKKAIELDPEHSEALFNLGLCLKQSGEITAAIEYYERAVRIRPDYTEAHNNLGIAYYTKGRVQDAAASYDRAISLKTDYAEAYNNRGVARCFLGLFSDSARDFERALDLKPDYANAHNNYGNLLKDQGRWDEAAQYYEAAIEINPEYAEAHRNLGTITPCSPGDPRIAQMDRLLSDASLGESDRIQLGFAMARASEDLGNYDESFEYLKTANALRKAEADYDIADDRQLFSGLTQGFEFLPVRELSIEEASPVTPVFIVGMPCAGLSLVERTLAAHSRVYGAGKLSSLVAGLTDVSWDILRPGASHEFLEEIRKLREGYLGALTALNVPETIITDKMPLNFRWIGFILAAFPGARIIHVTRPAMATCWSIYKHYFLRPGNEFAYDLEDLAAYYGLYRDLMRFWHRTFPGKIHEIEHDRLAVDTEPLAKQLLAYCGLPWEPECLAPRNTGQGMGTVQVWDPGRRDSPDAWKKYTSHLAPLMAALPDPD